MAQLSQSVAPHSCARQRGSPPHRPQTTTKLSNTLDGIVPPLVLSGAARDTVFFQARSPQAGNELHTATLAGEVKLVADLVVGNVHGWAEEITDMGSYVLFSGDKELYRSDGTQLGTKLVKDINAGSSTGAGPGQSYPRLFVRVNDKNMMVFSGEDGTNGRELWVSDGTTAGTKLLADVRPGSASSDPQDFTMVGAWLYFSADDGTHGRELHRILVR